MPGYFAVSGPGARTIRQPLQPQILQLETRESPTILLTALPGLALAGSRFDRENALPQEFVYASQAPEAELFPAVEPLYSAVDSGNSTQAPATPSPAPPVPASVPAPVGQPPVLAGESFFVGLPANPLEDPLTDAFPPAPADVSPGLGGVGQPPGQPESGGGGGSPGLFAAGDAGGGGSGGGGISAPSAASSDPGPLPASSSATAAAAAASTTGHVAVPPLAPAQPGASFVTASTPAGGIDGGLNAPTTSPQTTGTQLGKLPLRFEQNQGQYGTNPDGQHIQFVAHGQGYSMGLTSTGAFLSVSSAGSRAGPSILQMTLVGANPNAQPVGLDQLATRTNYFSGRDPAHWRTGVPNFARVEYDNVYPGINLIYHETALHQLEFDFVVQPGGNPSVIHVAYSGANTIQLDPQGNLVLQTPAGPLTENAPVVYQDGASGRQAVQGRYVLQGNQIGFQLGSYDHSRPLIIDPVVYGYSTYLGGTGADMGLGIAVDGAGSAYAFGVSATETGWPGLTTTVSGDPFFIAKFTPDGSGLVYLTFIDGNAPVAQGISGGIAVDAGGNAYITGWTDSTDAPNFPATSGVLQSTPQGGDDAVVAELDGAGLLDWGTFLGGSTGNDHGYGIAVDLGGNVFVAGSTTSTDFPTHTPYAAANRGVTNAFVVELTAGGSAERFGTYLGGTGNDVATAITLNDAGNAFVAGYTSSTDFPTVSAFQSTNARGANDAFLTEFSTDGQTPVLSTYYGGGGDDRANAICLDSQGNIFVAGSTTSTNLPTANAYQAANAGGSDAFLASFNSSASVLSFATYLGGGGDDAAFGVAVDGSGRATVVGATAASTPAFPIVGGLQTSNGGNNDAFVSRFTSAGGLQFSTYAGGSADDNASAVAVDLWGSLYVTGTTYSSDFPTYQPLQATNAGNSDAFVTNYIDVAVQPPRITAISPDTGISSTDQITNAQLLTISGTAPVGSTVTLKRRDFGVIGQNIAVDGTGAWSFDYRGTTLPEGTYTFVAQAVMSGNSSAESPEFPVIVDLTPPTINVSVPATNSSTPLVYVSAQDLNGLPNGTQVKINLDRNNDGNFTDANETDVVPNNGLTNGQLVIALPPLAPGTYAVQAQVPDLAGNLGTAPPAGVPFVISSISGYSVVSAGVATGGMPLEQLGDVRLSHALDLDNSPGTGQSGNPTLYYNSNLVTVKPIIQAFVATPNNVNPPLPSPVTVQLTWNGVPQYPSPVDRDTSSVNPGDIMTVAAQVQTAVTTTGRYPWSLSIAIPGQAPLTTSGTAFVRVEDHSHFGAGWTFAPLNTLFDIQADANGPAGKLWLYGDGTFRFFTGTSGTLTAPPNDPGDNGTLVKNADNTFTYTTPEQVKLFFDASGNETMWQSADTKETILFASAGGTLNSMTAIDRTGSTFTYSNGLISNIATAVQGAGTFVFGTTGTDLTQITDPDNRSEALLYTADQVTSDTRGILQNSYVYDTYNLDKEVHWGSSVTSVKPAAAKGLDAAVAAPLLPNGLPARLASSTDRLASSTDVGGAETDYHMDDLGRVWRQFNADGGIDTWLRDSAGRVSTYKDPLGRQTNYQRDAQGYVLVETLPDAHTRQYSYHATYHGVTSFTDENGKVTTSTYDPINGHLLSVTNTVTDVDQTQGVQQTTNYHYQPTTGLLDTITDPLSHVTTVAFDTARRLWTTTDLLGTTTLGYDPHGNLATSQDRLGKITTLTNDAMGRTTQSTDPATHAESWVYNTAGLLQTYTNKNGHTTTTTYDNRGLVLRVREADSTPDAQTTQNGYDAAGRLTSTVAANGATTTFTLDAMGRTLTSTNALRGRTVNQFDLAGQLLQTRDPIGNIQTNTYNSRGWVTQTTDARGKLWGTSYDFVGNVLSTTDPLNHGPHYEYDELNRARKITDANNHTSKTIWWGDGTVKETVDGRGTKTDTAYDWTNRQITTTQAKGVALLERNLVDTLDQMGNVISSQDGLGLGHTTTIQRDPNLYWVNGVRDPLGHGPNYTRDNLGNVTVSADGLGKQTTNVFDNLERQTKSTDPNTNVQKVVFNALDEPVRQIDGLGNVTGKAYDLLGREVADISAIRGVITKRYDGAGELISLTDEVGNTTRWIYNRTGQVTQEIDPRGKVTSFAYDDAGRLTSRVDRDNRERDFTYYFNNNLLGQEVWKDATGAIVNTINHTYNENDQELNTSDTNGTIARTYDELGRLKTQTDVYGNVLTYTWDAGDRLTGISDTKGGSVTNTYDNANRLTQLQFTNGTSNLSEKFGYSDRDQVTSVQRFSDYGSNNLIGSTTTGYDDGGRLTSITHKDAAGTSTLDNFGYVYDAADRVFQETTTLTTRSTKTYTYDRAGQLLSDGQGTYSYDKVGNRTMQFYGTDTGNRLSTDGIWNYFYDDEGNQTSKVNAGGETWNYFYDNINRLVRVEQHSRDGTLTQLDTFKYDALGEFSAGIIP
jgi:YD repeat-containing protein